MGRVVTVLRLARMWDSRLVPLWYVPEREASTGPVAAHPWTGPAARGHAHLAVVQLEQTLRALDGPDRAYVVSMLRELLEDATV